MLLTFQTHSKLTLPPKFNCTQTISYVEKPCKEHLNPLQNVAAFISREALHFFLGERDFNANVSEDPFCERCFGATKAAISRKKGTPRGMFKFISCYTKLQLKKVGRGKGRLGREKQTERWR
ncbi:unnamed protein product, partial [Ixodes pacificus]